MQKVIRVMNRRLFITLRFEVWTPQWNVYTFDSITGNFLEEAHFDDMESARRHMFQRLHFFAQTQQLVESELCEYTHKVELRRTEIVYVPKFVVR